MVDQTMSETNSALSKSNRAQKYPPYRQLNEPGAIVCRVARSFLRLTHLEIFHKRNEMDELMTMADFVCYREYPHLLDITIQSESSLSSSTAEDQLPAGPPERYVQLFREVTKNNAALVAEWLRVGYVQGNMNSDNTCLAGRTIDYGPYGWMEKYDPFYQPFTSDPQGNFAYIRQPTAMGVNIITLAETFESIIKQACLRAHGNTTALGKYLEEIKGITEQEYRRCFFEAFNEVRRRKLGFLSFDQEEDSKLWSQLDNLMAR
jgi:serine/tyrosine/threonine adenylyltransferase